MPVRHLDQLRSSASAKAVITTVDSTSIAGGSVPTGIICMAPSAAGLFTSIPVSVNDRPVGVAKIGKYVRYRVPAGDVVVKVQGENYWSGTFSVGPNEQRYLKIIGMASANPGGNHMGPSRVRVDEVARDAASVFATKCTTAEIVEFGPRSGAAP